MHKQPATTSFSRHLLRWYQQHGRILPWRQDLQQEKNPAKRAYRAWIAEIMLQQTTVATILSRYQPFLKKYPNINALAATPLENLMHAWQGMGYYARARRLHKAAQVLAREGFPSDKHGWQKLEGVGNYTAAALAAFLHGQSLLVLDTNIRRIYSRILTENNEKKLQEQAKNLLPQKNCGDYTQALMDLGATICKAREPRCQCCPVSEFCEAHKRNAVNAFPVLQAKPERPWRRATVLLVVKREGKRHSLLFRQSESEGLLGSLAELPASDFRNKNSHENWDAQKDLQKLFAKLPLKTKHEKLLEGVSLSHGFTHFRLQLHIAEAEAETNSETEIRPPYFWQKADPQGKFPTLALSTLMRKVLRQYASHNTPSAL